MRSAVKKRESLCEEWVSQSKQVFWVFTVNVDERALGDVQHPSRARKATQRSSTEDRRIPLLRCRDCGGWWMALMVALPRGKASRLPPKSQAWSFPLAFYKWLVF